MELYIARHPQFNRRMEVSGYRLLLCQTLRDYFYDLYREPDDAEELYRRFCFADFDGMGNKPAAVIEFSEELLERLVPLFPRNQVVVEYSGGDNSELTCIKDLRRIKGQGYRVSYDATVNMHQNLLAFADIVRLDFSALSLEAQFECIKNNKGKAKFLAGSLQSWADHKKALVLGYDYFEGEFFLKHLPGKQGAIRSFNTVVLHVMNELGQKEPNFKEIASSMEHDLNLSYRLLKFVNSAYIAPKFKIKTILQAITILGMNELRKFMSAMLIKEVRSPENAELLQRSLIRGKMMEHLANERKVPQKGTEAFFTGIFSLIDVLLNKSMEEVMNELPLTDAVKEALMGTDNDLKALLDQIVFYEKAQWNNFEGRYKPDITEQEKLVCHYISALKWSEAIDFY